MDFFSFFFNISIFDETFGFQKNVTFLWFYAFYKKKVESLQKKKLKFYIKKVENLQKKLKIYKKYKKILC